MTLWNNHLDALNWRIDVQTKSRHQASLNDALAIVELKIGKPDKSSETVRFQLDSDKLAFVVEQIDAIEKQIAAQASVAVVKPLIKAKPAVASGKPTIAAKPKPTAPKPSPARA